MWLHDITIINYKSCRSVQVTFSKDDPNVFIGINDCGKSTVLKAIGLLLQPKPLFHFPSIEKAKTDFSNSRLEQVEFERILKVNELPDFPYDKANCYIIGRFLLEEQDIKEEKLKKYSPHIQWLLENCDDGYIWIMRLFNENEQSIKDYIVTKDYIEDDVPLKLYEQTAKALKERSDALKIPKTDIQNDNNAGRYKNSEYVDAIYGKYQLNNTWVDIQLKDQKDLFPEFHYLDWNVSLEQLQSFTKTAINTKVSSHVDLAQRFAMRQAKKAQAVVDTELTEFTKLFAADFPNISSFKSNINFSLESKLTDILINKANTHGDIHLESQGEGIKRQIWFALIKWTALNSVDPQTSSKKFIWCFDEPETHLYPKAQRDFFELIKDVSQKNIQTFISTHSTVFIDRAKFDKIIRYELNAGYTQSSICKNSSDIFESLQIRNSDFLFYDKFIVVEGDTEEVLIPHLFKLHSKVTLYEKGIQLINLGGKDKRKQNQQILRGLLKDFNKTSERIVYLFDNDVKHDMGAKELPDNSFYVGKQDIEDAINESIWVKLINEKLSDIGIQVTAEKIIELKNEIQEVKINSNQKFYLKLKNHLKTLLPGDSLHQIDDRLPSKGKLSGQLMSTYLVEQEHIPKSISEAFQYLIEM